MRLVRQLVGAGVTSVRVARPSLEEVYLSPYHPLDELGIVRQRARQALLLPVVLSTWRSTARMGLIGALGRTVALSIRSLKAEAMAASRSSVAC